MRLLLVCALSALTMPAVLGDASAGDAPESGLEQRRQAVRARGRFFSKIAVKRDYRGEWVIARTGHSTAFLDIDDRRHPRSRSKGGDPPAEIHILVVPNQPREHIARKLGGAITASDLRAASAVFADARRLARRLGIAEPRIYANSESRIEVGYFHVHLRGSLPAGKKLPRLQR